MHLLLLSSTSADPRAIPACLRDNVQGFSYLRGRVLVAINPIQSLLRSVRDVFRGIVAARTGYSFVQCSESFRISHSQEALSHVYNWLHWRRSGGFVDDGP